MSLPRESNYVWKVIREKLERLQAFKNTYFNSSSAVLEFIKRNNDRKEQKKLNFQRQKLNAYNKF